MYVHEGAMHIICTCLPAGWVWSLQKLSFLLSCVAANIPASLLVEDQDRG